MVFNEIHGNVLMRMLSVTDNTHTQAELYIDYTHNPFNLKETRKQLP